MLVTASELASAASSLLDVRAAAETCGSASGARQARAERAADELPDRLA